MKKILAFILFTSFTCQLGAWTTFIINNDTRKTVELITESGRVNLKRGTTYTIINNRYSRKWYSTNNILKITNEIVLGKNEYWFKIGEKTPAKGRRYTIAPRIDIDNNTRGTIRVKDVLNIENKNLPEGFKYHEYSMGLKQPTQEETHSLGFRPIN